MNLELRRNQKMRMGVEIDLGGQRHFISAERQQILDLLISTYEQAVEINRELKLREKELAHSNEVLNALFRIAEGLNQAGSEREVAETVLERALELPGIQAGWISLREGESGFRLAAPRRRRRHGGRLRLPPPPHLRRARLGHQHPGMRTAGEGRRGHARVALPRQRSVVARRPDTGRNESRRAGKGTVQ